MIFKASQGNTRVHVVVITVHCTQYCCRDYTGHAQSPNQSCPNQGHARAVIISAQAQPMGQTSLSFTTCTRGTSVQAIKLLWLYWARLQSKSVLPGSGPCYSYQLCTLYSKQSWQRYHEGLDASYYPGRTTCI